jgi:hypothetical protein
LIDLLLGKKKTNQQAYVEQRMDEHWRFLRASQDFKRLNFIGKLRIIFRIMIK